MRTPNKMMSSGFIFADNAWCPIFRKTIRVCVPVLNTLLFFFRYCAGQRFIAALAGHPLRGWPARLRGHKGSGLWKVWTVLSPPLPSPALPCPLPSPPLPCPALPCPALSCPALPSPPFPSLPSLPPSRVPSRLAAPCRRNGGQPILMSARVWRRPAITK